MLSALIHLLLSSRSSACICLSLYNQEVLILASSVLHTVKQVCATCCRFLESLMSSSRWRKDTKISTARTSTRITRNLLITLWKSSIASTLDSPTSATEGRLSRSLPSTTRYLSRGFKNVFVLVFTTKRYSFWHPLSCILSSTHQCYRR